uniref:Endosulphine n=3 Tax=Setaria TaxID=4554 RepID=K4AGK7_SETIT
MFHRLLSLAFLFLQALKLAAPLFDCLQLQAREIGRVREQEHEMAGGDGAKSSASMEEEACVEKKYGGIAPKKPLISKDHERAYFDSADWVLGKQAANSSTRAAVESLKPKLKRTPHHQLPPRKPTCAST